MQKDVHFYVTYALARQAGLPAADAEVLAWADQFTDDLTASDLHGIQPRWAIAERLGRRFGSLLHPLAGAGV
jgi:hypothetical protein